MEFEAHGRLNWRRKFSFLVLFGTILLCILLFFFHLYTLYLNTPPSNFPVEVDIQVEEGITEFEIVDALEKHGVVRSSLYLFMYRTTAFPGEYIQAGTYHFREPLSTKEIAEAITKGLHLSPRIRLTFTEGFMTRDFLELLPQYVERDITDIEALEGYLFPDTYFISSETKLSELIALMESNFENKLAPYGEEIEASGFTKDEVIILASIIEREAKDLESKHIVSGILQNRLREDMPLQVDATFDYILDKTSAELTVDDLALDSPYNTYLYRGLPPTPISNPGIESIVAVLRPTQTDYLYYLTGKDGTFYYAETFEEHRENKINHL